jgi:hypothetical protein
VEANDWVVVYRQSEKSIVSEWKAERGGHERCNGLSWCNKMSKIPLNVHHRDKRYDDLRLDLWSLECLAGPDFDLQFDLRRYLNQEVLSYGMRVMAEHFPKGYVSRQFFDSMRFDVLLRDTVPKSRNKRIDEIVQQCKRLGKTKAVFAILLGVEPKLPKEKSVGHWVSAEINAEIGIINYYDPTGESPLRAHMTVLQSIAKGLSKSLQSGRETKTKSATTSDEDFKVVISRRKDQDFHVDGVNCGVHVILHLAEMMGCPEASGWHKPDDVEIVRRWLARTIASRWANRA